MKRHVFSVSTAVDSDILRTLRLLHEEQARMTSGALTGLLGGVELVRTELLGIEQRTYAEATDRGVSWVRVNVHSDSLASTVAFVLSVPFVRAFSEVLQGGDGHPPEGALTEVDLALARRVLERLVDSWRRAWEPLIKVTARVPDRIVTSVVFGDIGIDPHAPVLEVRYRVQGGNWPEEGMDQFSFCLPVSILESRAKIFRRENMAAGRRHPEEDGWKPAVWALIPVELTFCLRCQRVPVGRLLRLREGDIIPLAGTPTDAEVWGRGRLIARAEMAQNHVGFGVATKLTPHRGVEMSMAETGIGVDKVQIELLAVLGKAYRTVEELRNLEPDVEIILDQKTSEPMEIRANGVPVAEGEVYENNGQLAVRITRVLTPGEVAERAHRDAASA